VALNVRKIREIKVEKKYDVGKNRGLFFNMLSLHLSGTFEEWGTAAAQWLRCCATNRKVAGSTPRWCHWIFN